MIDLYFNDAGDIQRGPDGDIAVTNTDFRDYIQQAYIRMLTDIGDWTLYPTLGANLSSLFGQPQSSTTGQIGVGLIRSALDRERRFQGTKYTVSAVPVDLQTIRFDVSITTASQSLVTVSVAQPIAVQ